MAAHRISTGLECYDVLVCGGGPAGLGAALAASRSGAQTLLVEQHAMLGGLWTVGLLTPFFDATNKRGLSREIQNALAPAGYEKLFREDLTYMYHVGHLARLFDRLIVESGCGVQLHSLVGAPLMEGRQVVGVTVHSKSGDQPLRAKVVIDCTGDGDVAARAGCRYEMGRPEDGACQPATLFALVGGAPDETVRCDEITEAIAAAGSELTYAHPYLFSQPGSPGVALFMCNHLYRLDGTSAADLTRGEIEGRRLIVEAIDLLRRSGKPRFAKLHLIQFAGQIGIRETRRIRGHYYLTADEVFAGAQFDDGICDVTFNVDIHHMGGPRGTVRQGQGYRNVGYHDDGGQPVKTERGLDTKPVQPYQIPYRCLVPQDVEGLLVAGRCISGDHVAHASYRVTGDCAAMGEAAGVAAAMAARQECCPSQLDGVAVRAALDEYYRALSRP